MVNFNGFVQILTRYMKQMDLDLKEYYLFGANKNVVKVSIVIKENRQRAVTHDVPTHHKN